MIHDETLVGEDFKKLNHPIRLQVMKMGRDIKKDKRTVAAVLRSSSFVSRKIIEIESVDATMQIQRDANAQYKFWDALSMWLGVTFDPDTDQAIRDIAIHYGKGNI